MAVRGATRKHILATAGRLFQAQGYHGTGVNQILAEGDAPKGSLYFHFPGGKEQLAAEAVAVSAAELTERLSQGVSQAATPGEAIRSAADGLARQLAESDYLLGCPITTVALEAVDSEPVRLSCREGYDSWANLVARRLTDAGIDDDTAQELALLVLSSLEGALILARVRRDTTPLTTVAARLSALADAAVPTD